jgi:hypothetical protein
MYQRATYQDQDDQIKDVALMLLCAYSSNPAMNPSEVTTLTDLRKLAIDQARAFLQEVTTPAETPTAIGVRVSVAGEVYKIMKGDRATLGYVQARINEIVAADKSAYVDLEDIESPAKAQAIPGEKFEQDADLLSKLIDKW